MSELIPGYTIRAGGVDRALLLKCMQRTYKELFPEQDFSHLARTVEQYYSKETPLWWVELSNQQENPLPLTVACLWAGNAIDQVKGDRYTHIFLLYVVPEHRRRGIGTALMEYAENWAKKRGDRQIGLQVFQCNQPALNLYNQMDYESTSIWMVKKLAP
ncbi:GNAT family N-acetyltransferase [Gloeocapsopsis dulcis]|uniref:GNAT family N-acetyltransferase n=1 Tax=Gloeocapsopsis dulcis AAB1 = 1H9 TaxID=1433147 RepID=A0A6N8FZR3_9CHRO|nr:GNAT family N-acetyltransferase [Gloeocapsopsis dulcis]MUL38618.1 GNAT family N-acetyltransferase [Gloeocapsopsis dulcis AAB1 = 1H9]WNN88672.1 GNAT family N-acetyltransferase [Gloeocapsopsis dulcis]